MTSNRADIETGIVGLGNIGQYHAERLVELGVTLAGGMDIAAEARTRFARRYDVDVYDEHHELYDAVDAVIITTPNKYHEEYAVDAPSSGICTSCSRNRWATRSKAQNGSRTPPPRRRGTRWSGSTTGLPTPSGS